MKNSRCLSILTMKHALSLSAALALSLAAALQAAPVTGAQDLYLVFSGINGARFNLDWWKFE
jgi:hypothetical protein